MLLAAGVYANTIQEGQKAPDFTIKTVAGKSLRLTDLRGKVVLLDFWGVGCPPCKLQMPILQTWHKQYAGRGLVIVGIEAMGSKADLIRKSLKERGITYPVAPDVGNAMSKQYGVQAHPTTIVIDRAGKIVEVEVGYVRGDEKKIEAAFLPLLDRRKEQRP